MWCSTFEWLLAANRCYKWIQRVQCILLHRMAKFVWFLTHENYSSPFAMILSPRLTSHQSPFSSVLSLRSHHVVFLFFILAIKINGNGMEDKTTKWHINCGYHKLFSQLPLEFRHARFSSFRHSFRHESDRIASHCDTLPGRSTTYIVHNSSRVMRKCVI